MTSKHDNLRPYKPDYVLVWDNSVRIVSFDQKRNQHPGPFLLEASRAQPSVLKNALKGLEFSDVWPRLAKAWSPTGQLEKVPRDSRDQYQILRQLRIGNDKATPPEQRLQEMLIYGLLLGLNLVKERSPIIYIDTAWGSIATPTQLEEASRMTRLLAMNFRPIVDEVETMLAGRLNVRMDRVFDTLRTAATKAYSKVGPAWNDSSFKLEYGRNIVRSILMNKPQLEAVADDDAVGYLLGIYNFSHVTEHSRPFEELSMPEQLDRARRAADAVKNLVSLDIGLKLITLREFAARFTISHAITELGELEAVNIKAPIKSHPPYVVTREAVNLQNQGYYVLAQMEPGETADYGMAAAEVAHAFDPGVSEKVVSKWAAISNSVITQQRATAAELDLLAYAAAEYRLLDGGSMDVDGHRVMTGEFVFRRNKKLRKMLHLLPGTDDFTRSPDPVDVIAYGQHDLDGEGVYIDSLATVRDMLTKFEGTRFFSLKVFETQPIDASFAITPESRAVKLGISKVVTSIAALYREGRIPMDAQQAIDPEGVASVVSAAEDYNRILALGGEDAVAEVAMLLGQLIFGRATRVALYYAAARSSAQLRLTNLDTRLALCEYGLEVARMLVRRVIAAESAAIENLFDTLQQNVDRLANHPDVLVRLNDLVLAHRFVM